MNKVTCMIIDDEPQAIDLLAEQLSSLYENLEIVATFSHWNKALEGMRHQEADIIFLDISMNGKSGLDLVRCLPANIKSEVVFVTAFADYALDAFRLSAGGYILKPIVETELIKTVDRVLSRVYDKRSATQGSVQAAPMVQKIGIPGVHAIDYINTGDIIFLEAVNSYTNVHTTERKLISSYNLQKFKQSLSDPMFFQVHRSYLVNLNHVKRYENIGLLVMDNEAEVPVSKNVRDSLLQMFNRVKGEQLKRNPM